MTSLFLLLALLADGSMDVRTQAQRDCATDEECSQAYGFDLDGSPIAPPKP
jgi:hypothetical protein